MEEYPHIGCYHWRWSQISHMFLICSLNIKASTGSAHHQNLCSSCSAIYEFPDGASTVKISAKVVQTYWNQVGSIIRLFRQFTLTVPRLLHLVSRCNRNQLFTVTMVDGFLYLITFDGDSFETVSTRPFSVVTKKDCQRSVISSIGISPDSAVVFFLDKALSSIVRMEIDSCHCRSFGHELCCKYIY